MSFPSDAEQAQGMVARHMSKPIYPSGIDSWEGLAQTVNTDGRPFVLTVMDSYLQPHFYCGATRRKKQESKDFRWVGDILSFNSDLVASAEGFAFEDLGLDKGGRRVTEIVFDPSKCAKYANYVLMRCHNFIDGKQDRMYPLDQVATLEKLAPLYSTMEAWRKLGEMPKIESLTKLRTRLDHWKDHYVKEYKRLSAIKDLIDLLTLSQEA
jgi:hypothetical protein